MSLIKYRVRLLEFADCPLCLTPQQFLRVLKAWRNYHKFADTCVKCKKRLKFGSVNFGLCCERLYFNTSHHYLVTSIAVSTAGYTFVLPQLKRMIKKSDIQTNQEFLVLPDPAYWQMKTTLIYEKVMKFVLGEPMTRRTKIVQPVSKTPVFYKQIQQAPLNYGSLDTRSCGKATFIRQAAFGKRCLYSMRGMIVPDPNLKPNQIRMPDYIAEKFNLKGSWVLLNRMPSLQPENFVALQVPVDGPSWPYDCFGIPLEILPSINGDFDGDEVNIYLFFSHLAQAECATLMNPEWEMGSFVMGIKLGPCQDMLVAYYKYFDEIDFLPYKHRDLKTTFRVVYELYGSKAAFKAVDDMRKFYLKKFEEEIFSISLEEILGIVGAFASSDENLGDGCLITQTKAKAKGNFELIRQMFGRVGMQGDYFVKNSFWSGLTSHEAVAHAKISHMALWQTSKIWQPGYSHNQMISNVQGLVVDYLGRLIDGQKRVVESDVLYAVHFTDVITPETVEYIFTKVIINHDFDPIPCSD